MCWHQFHKIETLLLVLVSNMSLCFSWNLHLDSPAEWIPELDYDPGRLSLCICDMKALLKDLWEIKLKDKSILVQFKRNSYNCFIICIFCKLFENFLCMDFKIFM